MPIVIGCSSRIHHDKTKSSAAHIPALFYVNTIHHPAVSPIVQGIHYITATTLNKDKFNKSPFWGSESLKPTDNFD